MSGRTGTGAPTYHQQAEAGVEAVGVAAELQSGRLQHHTRSASLAGAPIASNVFPHLAQAAAVAGRARQPSSAEGVAAAARSTAAEGPARWACPECSGLRATRVRGEREALEACA